MMRLREDNTQRLPVPQILAARGADDRVPRPILKQFEKQIPRSVSIDRKWVSNRYPIPWIEVSRGHDWVSYRGWFQTIETLAPQQTDRPMAYLMDRINCH